MTFQEEFIGLLEKYKIEYDERYLWDQRVSVTRFAGLGFRYNIWSWGFARTRLRRVFDLASPQALICHPLRGLLGNTW